MGEGRPAGPFYWFTAFPMNRGGSFGHLFNLAFKKRGSAMISEVCRAKQQGRLSAGQYPAHCPYARNQAELRDAWWAGRMEAENNRTHYGHLVADRAFYFMFFWMLVSIGIVVFLVLGPVLFDSFAQIEHFLHGF